MAASALSCLRTVANTSWNTLRSSRNATTTFWARARSSSLMVSTSGRTESHSDRLIVWGLPATTSCAKSTRSLGSQGQSASTIPRAALGIEHPAPLRAGREVVANASINLTRRVARRNDFDCQVRRAFDRPVRGQIAPTSDERDVRDSNGSFRELEGLFSYHKPQFAL